MRATALAVALIVGCPTASLLAAPQDQGGKVNIERGLQSNYIPTKMAGFGDRLRATQLGPEPVAPRDAQVAQKPPPAPQPEPVQIGLGQTTDQVVANLGQPDKVVDLGSKKIYIYKDLKITFVDGKVSDVQ
jgi:hypothetical protein